MLAILSNNRRFITTGLLVFFSLGFLGFFAKGEGVNAVFQGFIVSIVFFLIVPLAYGTIVLKESLKNLGLQKGNPAAGILASIGSIIVAGAVVVWLALTLPAFREQYVFPVSVETGFVWFILYELVLVSSIALLYEVFFRGLIGLLWLRAFGMISVFMQAAIFFGLVYFSGGISWQMAPLLIFCPFAGFIAYRSQSIWYSFAASWTFLFLTDVFFLILR